jgi:hypothetical protein
MLQSETLCWHQTAAHSIFDINDISSSAKVDWSYFAGPWIGGAGPMRYPDPHRSFNN